MSNKQQTAVEWLVDQLEKHYVFQDIKNTTAFLQAKEMEKEQMIDFGAKCLQSQNEKQGGNK
jgi:hypothetical protein